MTDDRQTSSNNTPSPAEAMLQQLLSAQLQEQKTSRIWAMARRGISLLVLLVVTLVFVTGGPESGDHKKPHVALINLSGVILPEGEIDALLVGDALKSAFESETSVAVVLRINSPGGSPVQSALIYDEIRRYRSLYPNKPVYAVIEDVGASGGYYIAVAADQIYVNGASLIGSVGVRMDGFGFTELMKKVGVERRLLTAGENKAPLDPFLPENPQQKARMQTLLAEVHQQFIAAVKEGRGKRLKDDPTLFSGAVFNGAKGVELGLADALGSVRSVTRDVIQNETLVDYTVGPSFSERLAKRFGAGVAVGLSQTLRSDLAPRH